MDKKIRPQGDWEKWKSANAKHDLEILAINVAVILSVFVCALIIQP